MVHDMYILLDSEMLGHCEKSENMAYLPPNISQTKFSFTPVSNMICIWII